MCGIAGVWGDNALERTTLMLPLMEHRGPDGDGLWSHQTLTLGHKRLAINDLSEAGSQPMQSADGNIVISVNGEIYNYPALRSELETKGCQFFSSSDSEVIIHAWKVWGEACFERFNGMFAIALFDVQNQTLVLARDRLGIKPLYFHKSDSNGLVFASETKALLAGLNNKPAIDPIGLAQYLSYQNYFGQRTLREGVSMLPPGQLLIATSDKVTLQAYWQLKFNHVNTDTDFEQAVTDYRSTLNDSVSRHLMSDVPVASYLSAGFDSATVANRASHLGKPPVCFTGTFSEGGWYDETSVARAMAQHNNSKHISVQISFQDVPRVLDKLIYALDEPRMGMGALSQYCVAERVAETHKVILTGHGGDELFSGYPVFKLVHLMQTFLHNPVTALKALPQLKVAELPHLAYFLMGQVRSKPYQQFLPVLNSVNDIQAGLKPEYADALRNIAPEAELIDLDQQADNAEEILYSHYLQAYLNGLLVVEDKLSMAHSLESRTPMLDNAMLDLSLKIPQAIKLNNGVLKAVIKEGGRSWLPDVLYKQPKRGFPTPLRLWLRGPLKDWLAQRLIGPDSALPQIFKPEWVRKTHDEYQYSFRKQVRALDEIQSHRIWQLLCLESWLKQQSY